MNINNRIEAVSTILKRSSKLNTSEKKENIFKQNVFSKNTMQNYLSQKSFTNFINALDRGNKISDELANDIAAAMKSWAISKGVTHYTHWFQPLTGITAEKHDSFFDLNNDESIQKFEGSQLVQQEPDASSFPSGGIRTTFEARGYTAWDPTSPAFIYANTLCIPTIFVSYTGEALDYKTPLLRSLQALDKAATDVGKYFDKNINKVAATLGWEQEYFLIDKTFLNSRPDILMTGRTLTGHAPAKGQQLDDHYFGSISTRVINFMQELENESLKLGIPLKTRHNEVAPNQFELSPIFKEVNLSVDHNSLLMDIIEKIANKHNFKVLLHEKPFAGINGSGKHNNWSLATNTGVNLLSPGKNPMGNLQFLTFFINTIAAIYKHESLLSASISSHSNDNRLGGDEAPPSIFSIFIGTQLTKVLGDLEKISKGKLSPEEKTEIKLNIVGKIPEILLDNTDRNRTSPFAFTGNKFEFRAVGSGANCAKPMTVLNAIVAEQLIYFKKQVDELIEKKEMKKDDAIFNLLRDTIKLVKNILFEGDGYSEKWKKEAKKRGLSNSKNCPSSLLAYTTPKSIKLFEILKIMSKKEVEARFNVDIEVYSKKIQIESRVLGEIAVNQIIPVAIKYQNELLENLRGLREIYSASDKKYIEAPLKTIKKISEHISNISKKVDEMIEERKKANAIKDIYKKAIAYAEKITPYFETIRYHCDKLEFIVNNNYWPLSKYRELLFYK